MPDKFALTITISLNPTYLSGKRYHFCRFTNRRPQALRKIGEMMDKIFRRTKTGVIITGITLTLLGIIMFMRPIITLTVIVLIAGWILLALGIVTLINSVVHRKNEGSSFGLGIVVGAVEAILGLCIVIWPASFLFYLYIVLGIIVIITGLGDIVESFGMRKAGYEKWGIALMMGILTLILGVLVVISPFAFLEFVTVITGITLVFGGVTEVVAGIMMSSSTSRQR